MKTIPIPEVVVPPDRLRKDFVEEQIEELAVSIARIGLIHLPVLRDNKTLVAGERRFRAIKLLSSQGKTFNYLDQPVPPGTLPYASFEELDDLQAKEIELHENAVRVDIPWQIRVKAFADLHELRTQQNPDWMLQHTIKEVSGTTEESHNPTFFKERIILSKHLNNPTIRAAKSETEAVSRLKKEFAKDFEAALRQKVKTKKSKHKLIHGDAHEEIGKLKDEHYDLIISDPPYGIDADKHNIGTSFGRLSHEYKDTYKAALTHYALLADEGFRIAKPQAHIYLFLAHSMWQLVFDTLENYGWKVWPRPIIWYKHTGNLPLPDLGPRYVHEFIIYANKGRRPVTGLYPDVIDQPKDAMIAHAAAKPVEVYKNLMQRTLDPGNTVIDPFCGSGPVFPAAESLHCVATGIEMEEDFVSLCKERINKLGEENGS